MIGPQPGFDRDSLERVVRYDAHPLKAIEPDLKRYIDPMRGRRMAKVARIGIGCGLNALERAGVKVPEAIIVGTGLGCMESTERFFGSMIQQDEMLPNPTAFIQSTHNNVAGQLALAVKCTGANFTYLHRGLSFTSALLDGLVQVGLESARQVLVGGAEVITEDYFITQRHSGIWKQGSVANLEVLGSMDRGALCGEGAAFFVLDAEPQGERPVRVADVDIAYRGGAGGMQARIEEFLQRNGLQAADIDLLMVGRGGDAELDQAYGPVEALFPGATLGAFKHLCGEFYVANAFGTWLAWSALTTGALPAEALLRSVPDRSFRTALLCDHFQLKDHSLVLLRS